MPESTEMHFIVEWDVPGNASAKARTRTRASVHGSSIRTASADEYNYRDGMRGIIMKIKDTYE
jgi:hypothetical protein